MFATNLYVKYKGIATALSKFVKLLCIQVADRHCISQYPNQFGHRVHLATDVDGLF